MHRNDLVTANRINICLLIFSDGSENIEILFLATTENSVTSKKKDNYRIVYIATYNVSS